MTQEIVKNIDVTGHKCPVPVLRLRKFLETIDVGSKIILTATDPMTELDIPHFCHQAGHKLLGNRQEAGIFIFEIEKA